MISLIVENLSNGNQRVTSNVSGRTIKYVDAPKVSRELCIEVLRAAAFAHEITRGVFDMTYIRLNDEARKIMG